MRNVENCFRNNEGNCIIVNAYCDEQILRLGYEPDGRRDYQKIIK